MKQNISKLVKDIKSFLKNENNKAKGVVKITQLVSRFLSYSTEAEMFECHQAMERAVILLESDKSVSMIQTQKGYYSGRDLFVSLLVFRKPCKEFVQLYKYLKKYAAYDLELETFFHQRLLGKRNSVDTYDEQYLAYMPNICNRVLAWLRANKATSYVIIIKEEERSEKDELAYRAEREWYGWQENCLKIQFLTKKTGKVKAESVFGF